MHLNEVNPRFEKGQWRALLDPLALVMVAEVDPQQNDAVSILVWSPEKYDVWHMFGPKTRYLWYERTSWMTEDDVKKYRPGSIRILKDGRVFFIAPLTAAQRREDRAKYLVRILADFEVTTELFNGSTLFQEGPPSPLDEDVYTNTRFDRELTV